MCDKMCLLEGGNPNLAGVRGWISKIKRCGARTFISDGPGRDRIVPACCFPPSVGVMFAGSMCCKVRVVLAWGATPAPVLRVNPILPNAWWAAERRKARRKEWKCWQRWSWKPNPNLTLNTQSATSCSPSQTSTPFIAVCLLLTLCLSFCLASYVFIDSVPR